MCRRCVGTVLWRAMACVGTVYGVQALGVRVYGAMALGVRMVSVCVYVVCTCVYRSMTW